jgi:hypothetical protein
MHKFNRAAVVAGLAGLALAATLAPRPVAACACGCGVFDVGTSSMFPDGQGAMLFVENDYMDQNGNWSGSARAPSAANADKRIRTNFLSVGAQFMLSRRFGVVIEAPYWARDFTTLDESGNPARFQHGALGDLRIKGVYTGFSEDMSTGLTFGAKLPTGDSSYANFDPDTEIGTGSTDLLLGAYHLGNLTADGRYNYFVQSQWDLPVRARAVYRPGAELVGVAGGYYSGWQIGPVRVAPIAQLTAAWRGHDGGALGHPGDSGYTRLLATPGLELGLGRSRLYLDVAYSLYDNVSGNQLVARRLYKLNFSYGF